MPRTGLTPAELRTRAVEVALERIRAHGFEKVRLTDVAHELGVSHAALYAHFASKEALLDAVLEAWLEETTAALEAVCASKRKPMQKIERWFLEQYALKRDRARNDRAVYAAFAMETAANKPFTCAYLERRRQQLVGLLEAARGLLGDDAPQRQAAVLLDGMAGFLHPRLILESAETNREAELKRLLHTLLRGLAAPR
jgi:AcrR family transcriptional regulator